MFYLNLTGQFIIRVLEVWGSQLILLMLIVMTITKLTGDKAWMRKKFYLLRNYMFGKI